MLNLVSEHNVKVQTNAFKGLNEIPKAIALAYSGKMKGKPVIIIDDGPIANEKKSGLEMV